MEEINKKRERGEFRWDREEGAKRIVCGWTMHLNYSFCKNNLNCFEVVLGLLLVSFEIFNRMESYFQMICEGE